MEKETTITGDGTQIFTEKGMITDDAISVDQFFQCFLCSQNLNIRPFSSNQ